MKRTQIAILAGLAVAVAAGIEVGSTLMSARLEVAVGGVTGAGGTLVVGLYDEATFPATPLFTRQMRASEGASVVFERLPPGSYALKAFQDVNGDGRREANEPEAISNGAGGTDFTAATIMVRPGTNRAQLLLH